MMLKVVFLLVSMVAVSTGLVRLCGDQLLEALSMLCDDKYYDPDTKVIKVGALKRCLQDDPYLSKIFTPEYSNALLERINGSVSLKDREKRREVDDCCRNTCDAYYCKLPY